jgi:hypothetical protein
MGASTGEVSRCCKLSQFTERPEMSVLPELVAEPLADSSAGRPTAPAPEFPNNEDTAWAQDAR